SEAPVAAPVELALADETAGLVARYPDRGLATSYERELRVVVDRERARFSTWYELFPRSASDEPGRHGTFEDVEARLSYVASPDHPYVREHPEWFRRRPDGSVQYAENPPKRYEDIYPFDFGTEAWWELWQELLGVVRFWTEQGVRIFRVDNPHTKPFVFWEWL